MTTYDCRISALLEVEATAPSKTDPTNNEHTTSLVAQEPRPLDLKCTLHQIWCIQIMGRGTGFMVPAPPSSAQDARPALAEH